MEQLGLADGTAATTDTTTAASESNPESEGESACSRRSNAAETAVCFGKPGYAAIAWGTTDSAAAAAKNRIPKASTAANADNARDQ